LKISFSERFRRQSHGVDLETRAAILDRLLDLRAAMANPHEHRGVGLRKLHTAGVWELRVGWSLRAVFRLAPDEAIFQFLGTHDEVQRFLRTL